jgi:hypothetical protein
MRRGRYGNPWWLKLQFISVRTATPYTKGSSSRPAAGSGQKKVTCGRPWCVAVTHPFKVANRRILPANQTVPLWESVT